MEILFNKDGSIKYFVPFEYVQQGNDGVNVIKIAIEDLVCDEWQAIANFKLPNGDITSIVIDMNNESAGPVWVNNVKGWEFWLTNEQTLYAGVVEMSISFLQYQKTLFTYKTNIIVNKTPFDPSTVNITYSEYQTLVRALNNKLGSRASIHTETKLTYDRIKGESDNNYLLSYIICSPTKENELFLAYGYPSRKIRYRIKDRLLEKSPQDLVHQNKHYGEALPIGPFTLLDLLQPDYVKLEQDYEITKQDLLNTRCYKLSDKINGYGSHTSYEYDNSGFCFEINVPYEDIRGELDTDTGKYYNNIRWLLGNSKNSRIDINATGGYIAARKKIYLCDKKTRNNGENGINSYYCSFVRKCYYLKLWVHSINGQPNKTLVCVRFIDLTKRNPAR